MRLAIGFTVALQFAAFAGADAAFTWQTADAKKVDELKADLKKNLSADFRILNVGPWVIATDMDEAQAKSTIAGCIDGCGAGIQQQLFTKKQRTEPVKVYLFKDGESYNGWNKKLFGEKPSSIFGYFSRAKNSLVMNIGTGGGTLIHEMVHAMAEIDFPDIPAWLNEGLGSLYEASSWKGKRVMGITNWRWKGLKEDLDAGKEPKLKDLIGMDDSEFYGERQSSNYAVMRYFMQWIQTEGKLEEFYWRVRDKKDANPQASLRAVFDNKMNLDEIHKKVMEWAKTLR